MPRDVLACLVFVLLTLTGCPICEDCLADGSSGTDTSGDGDGEPAVCGDGIVQPGEECDDGNTNEFDTCTTLCVTSVELELSFSAIKQFDFSWAAVPGAEFYQLLESPALGEPFVQIGEDIVGESISITMPLYLRVNASYMLRACNANTCLDSASVDVASTLKEAVGYFKPSQFGLYTLFGSSVTLSGDGSTLAIGAPQEFDVEANQGAVYVFASIGAVWSQQAHVNAPNPKLDDRFGNSVTLSSDGNTLAVGAPQISGEETVGGSGEAYVFIRNGDVWSQQALVKASNPDEDDEFGWDVALSGDGNTLAVSAIGEGSSATGIDGNQADNSALQSGAVYVFVRDGNVWSQQAYVKASNTDTGDYLGTSVALSGDGNTLAVGAWAEDSNATGIDGNQADDNAFAAGAVYVFVRDGVDWSQQVYVKASNTEFWDEFGHSVALSGNGDTLAVGAWAEDSNATGVNGDQDDNSMEGAGAAYVFVRIDGVWSQQAYIKASNTDAPDEFGWSVALSGDGNTLAVGAESESSNAAGIDGDQADDSATQSGAAYVFVREGANWSQQAYVKASNTHSANLFGYEVGVANDGNTLAVGAVYESSGATGIGGNQDDNSASASGAVYLY